MSRSEIDAIWMHAAGQLGFEVTRTDAAYATSDGRGGIAIGVPETLDLDDCLAQLVFHELCHAMVQGSQALPLPDWGLDNTNTDDDHAAPEYAALRLQAFLADGHDLRALMAPTTQWRPYYERLPALALEGDDEAAVMAATALNTELYRAWFPILNLALEATRRTLLAPCDP